MCMSVYVLVVYLSVCLCMCMCTCMYVHLCIWVCLCLCIYLCVFTSICVCVLCVCIYVCLCLCVYVCVCFWVINFEMDVWPHSSTEAIPIYWRWPLQLLSPLCWVLKFKSLPLGPGSQLSSLASENFWWLPPEIVHPPHLHITIQFSDPLYLTFLSLPIHDPAPLVASQIPHYLPHETILFPL